MQLIKPIFQNLNLFVKTKINLKKLIIDKKYQILGIKNKHYVLNR